MNSIIPIRQSERELYDDDDDDVKEDSHYSSDVSPGFPPKYLHT